MLSNKMQARILEWKEKANDRNNILQELEAYNQASARDEAEKRRAANINDALQKTPLRYQHKQWTDFTVVNDEQKKIKYVMERYATSFTDRLISGNNVIFTGKPGTGKTLLSLLVYQQLIKDGFRCAYEPSLDFLRTLQEKKFTTPGVFNNAIASYKQIAFLIIDEVTEGGGKNRSLTDWENELLFKIINLRYQQQRCTLVISNRNRENLRACLGEATYDRLSEKGIALTFNWKSYRQ
jgi:DNA replication protein DnaC